MTDQRAIGTSRAICLIARLTLRRQLNMVRSIRFPRAKKTGEAQRSGTATKSGRRNVIGGVLLLVLAANGFFLGSSALLNLSAVCRNATFSSDKIPVSRYTLEQLIQIQGAMRSADSIQNSIKRAEYRDAWDRFLDQVLRFEIRWRPLTEAEEGTRLRQMREVFFRKGPAGFTIENPGGWLVSKTTWPSQTDAGARFFHSLSLIVLLWIPILLALPLGMNNKDLGQAEWSFEWLYTFPVPARALLAGKLFTYAFLNAIGWCFLFPFMIVVFVAGGYGVTAAIALGVATTAYMELLAAAGVLILEIALRKFLSLGQIKNCQALFTVVGTISLVLFYAMTLPSPLESFLVRNATALPRVVDWNPFLLPLLLAVPPTSASQLQLDVFAMIFAALAAGGVALFGGEFLVRGGLVTTGAPYQGERGKRRALLRGSWLRGVAAQEIALLARDRNLQVQVLLLPLLLPAFYLLTDYRMLRAIIGNARHAAALVFFVGAYTFLIGVMQLLTRERKTLWYLLSFPHSLTSILARKTAAWAAVGLVYGGAVLALSIHFSSHLPVSSWAVALLALYGIVLYAFVASGIGILATDVQETESRTALGVGPIYLYMILAGMYAPAFYAPSLWTKLALVVLCTLLALALWQKVNDLCPYLLDPAELPPRTINLADGMIAAFAFFVLQGLAALLLHYFSALSPTAQITGAYILAGLVVTCAALSVLWLRGVPDLWRQIGVAAGIYPRQATSARRSLMLGAALGLAAALGAFVYIHVLGLFPTWRLWEQDAESMSFMSSAGQPLWICALAVLAAPLFEEFIFRGLLFQGLRRGTGPTIAIVGSAAVFALVHPPIAVIPVFGLGIAAAVSFDRSRLIWAPIVTHAVYNSCVLFLR